MSLIAVCRNEKTIICMSDSACTMKYKIGNCSIPTSTKIFLYEKKYIIQNCGLGTLGGYKVEEHIERFVKDNVGLSIDNIPKKLLKYLCDYANNNKIKLEGNNSIVLLVSGWDNGVSKVYSINTENNKIILETDDVIAYGTEVEAFKQEYHKEFDKNRDMLFAMFYSFAIICKFLKTEPIRQQGNEISLEELFELAKDPRVDDYYGKICEPIDFIIIDCGKEPNITITKDKENTWLSKED